MPANCQVYQSSSAAYLRQRRLSLGQPEFHLHGAVQGDGRGQLGVGRPWTSRLRIEATETEVAVGQERAHAQICGERYGLLVGGCGGLDLQGSALRGDLAIQPQGVCLMVLLPVVTGAYQGTLGKLVCLLRVARQEVHFTEMSGPERITDHKSRSRQRSSLL